MSSIVLEVCVDSMASALAARDGGAQRIELCANLFEGGTTPSAGTIEIARKQLNINIHAMIRPRGGDFLYSDLEFAIMQRDIEIAKAQGMNGIVIGLLTADGEIDRARTQLLIELARPMSVTFHRAFDMVTDPIAALDALIALRLDRVLTSGLESTALEGAETIAHLIGHAAGRIIIMPGGGISERNVAKIMRLTGATEIHMSGRTTQESHMRYRTSRVSLGGSLHTPEYSQQVTSAARIRASLDAASGRNKPH